MALMHSFLKKKNGFSCNPVNTAKSQSQEIKSIDSLVNLCIENSFINGDLLIAVNCIKNYYLH